MWLQVIDAAAWLEAAANGLGQIGRAGVLAADRFGHDGTQLGFHRVPVAGGADTQLFLHRGIDVADSECGHGYVSHRSNACIRGSDNFVLNEAIATIDFWTPASSVEGLAARDPAPRASAVAVIGLQLHHPQPVHGDLHAVTAPLWNNGPSPSVRRRLEGQDVEVEASQDRLGFLPADAWISWTARLDGKGKQQHLPHVRLLPVVLAVPTALE